LIQLEHLMKLKDSANLSGQYRYGINENEFLWTYCIYYYESINSQIE